MKIQIEVDVPEVCDDKNTKCLFNREIPKDEEPVICCFAEDESVCDLFHEIVTAYIPCKKCQDARTAKDSIMFTREVEG